MTTTDYHNWDIPTGGASVDEWGRILNEFFDGPLDGSVALRGPLTDRPANAPPNAVFHATDRDEFYRFDSDMGQWVAASAHVDEARFRHDSATGARALYQQTGAGGIGSELRHTQQVVGTRHTVGLWPMIPRSGPLNEAPTYSFSGTDAIAQTIRYAFFEQPPNMVPVLRMFPTFGCDAAAANPFKIGVRVRQQRDGEYASTFEVAPGNTETLYDEAYLNEIPYGSSGRASQTLRTAIDVHIGGLAAGQSSGDIYAQSWLALDWEVV